MPAGRLWGAALSLALMGGGAVAAPMDFDESLGVNTHVYALATPYGNLPAVLAALRYLGVRHIRDNPPRAASPARYLALERDGIGLDLLVRSNTEPDLPLFEQLAPGLDAIEGPNEVNAHPNSLFYHGLSQFPAAVLLQARLYDAVKADPKLARVPVAMFSAVYHGPADLPPYPGGAARADFANVHAYPAGAAAPPDAYLPRDVRSWAAAVPGAPVLVTELGYFTLPDAPRGAGVSEDAQARWTLDALADDYFREHVSRQYIYELVDKIDAGGVPDKENHFGLFDLAWSPKPAAVAVHNLTTLLRGAGARPGGVVLSGLPPGAHSGLLGDAKGDLFLLLWDETDGAAAAVSVTFPRAAMISVYDPLRSPTAARTARGRRISVGLAGDLLIVKAAA